MTLQLIDAALPIILVVNIMDEAERMGLVIDIPLLEKRLGIPVIGAATAKKEVSRKSAAPSPVTVAAHRLPLPIAGVLRQTWKR